MIVHCIALSLPFQGGVSGLNICDKNHIKPTGGLPT